MDEEVSSPSHLSETTHNSYLSKVIEDVSNGNSGGGGGGGGSITSTLDSIPNHSNRDLSNPIQASRSMVKKNKRVLKEGFGSSSSSSTQHRGLRVMNKRRNPKVLFGGGGGRRGESDLDAIALPLGMSFAAVVAQNVLIWWSLGLTLIFQVLDSKTIADERISADHLSMLVIISAGGCSFKRCFIRIDDRLVLAEICTSAVKESLANVFGDRFDSFVRNFEKSFGSTLRTLRMINKASTDKGIDLTGHSSTEDYGSDVPHSTLNKQGHPFSGSSMPDCQSETVPPTCGLRDPFAFVEEVKETFRPCSMNQELVVHGQKNQHLASVSRSTLGSGVYQPMMNTLEKSVMEQARSNDLKAFEIGLRMEKLRLTESQLALSSDSHSLEKFKLSMGISKASFRAEKFKTQLEDTRHGELLKKCIDSLVAGLFIMSSSLLYGAYTYSYQRITEATSSCLSPPKESKSWFIPKSVSSFNSGLHSIRCQVEVFSRMLFGVLMILCIAYLLLQRSSAPNQTMPITFILLLLCGVCGFAGKLCVDTIGGSGYVWLLYWEVLCILHFFANIFTSALFFLLHGSLSVTQEIKASTKLPFWIRRVVFYAVMVVLLPLSCGLMPFAGLGDWKDHFSSLAIEALYRSAIYERS